MKLMFGPENAIMELAAVSIAGIVWAFWNMVSPEKEEEEKVQTVRIELIGQDRIEKVGAKDWMEPLTGISAWRPLRARIGKERLKSWRARQIIGRDERRD